MQQRDSRLASGETSRHFISNHEIFPQRHRLHPEWGWGQSEPFNGEINVNYGPLHPNFTTSWGPFCSYVWNFTDPELAKGE